MEALHHSTSLLIITGCHNAELHQFPGDTGIGILGRIVLKEMHKAAICVATSVVEMLHRCSDRGIHGETLIATSRLEVETLVDGTLFIARLCSLGIFLADASCPGRKPRGKILEGDVPAVLGLIQLVGAREFRLCRSGEGYHPEDKGKYLLHKALSLDEFYTAVLGATFLCLVIGNGFVRALTNSLQIETVNS